MNFIEQFVQRGQNRIYAREYAGEEPTIILMHGFPDNLLHELFPASDLFLLPHARHFVQMDEPEEVARLILSTPTAESNSN